VTLQGNAHWIDLSNVLLHTANLAFLIFFLSHVVLVRIISEKMSKILNILVLNQDNSFLEVRRYPFISSTVYLKIIVLILFL